MFDSSSADRDIICEDNYNLYSTCYSGYWKASRNGCIRRCWTISNGCQHSWGFDSLFKIFLALFCKCKSCRGKVSAIYHYPWVLINLLFACFMHGYWKIWWKLEYTLYWKGLRDGWTMQKLRMAKEEKTPSYTSLLMPQVSLPLKH